MQTLAAAGAGLLLPVWRPRSGQAAARLGDVPSRVALNDLKGKSVAIPSDFKGKIALLHFWASWCPTCRGEMTVLEALYAQYGDKGVVPCSIGMGEKRETALSYIKNLVISYPVLLDPDLSSRKPFAVSGIPTYYVLDRQGAIRHRILGEAPQGGLERMIGTLL
ncbi:MAG: TlpA disulfide reductase family protein [Deltaproteobacteria bacterium]|nr:TlpA disulfide reductase family protein [Deltaproteobacteria bacterium]